MESPSVPAATFVGYLGRAERAALWALGTQRRYLAGAFVILEGDPTTHVVVVVAGRTKAWTATRPGERLLLGLQGPGDVLGELAALEAAGAGPGGWGWPASFPDDPAAGAARSATVEAIEDTTARVIAGPVFVDYLLRHPQASLALARTLIDRLRRAERLRHELVVHDATTRVTRQLAELAEVHGQRAEGSAGLVLRVSQEELAGWVGASRESVIRAVGSLRRRGLVRTRYRTIEVLDLDGLRRAGTPR